MSQLSWIGRRRRAPSLPSLADELERSMQQRIYGERRVVERVFGPKRARPDDAPATRSTSGPSIAVPPGGLAIRECLDGMTVVLELAGDLDLATTGLAREAIRNAIAKNPKRFVIDLSELSFIDSTGINLMVLTHRQLGAALEIRPGGRVIQRVFELLHLDETLPFVERCERST